LASAIRRRVLAAQRRSSAVHARVDRVRWYVPNAKYRAATHTPTIPALSIQWNQPDSSPSGMRGVKSGSPGWYSSTVIRRPVGPSFSAASSLSWSR
jgi:hypothetical protein